VKGQDSFEQGSKLPTGVSVSYGDEIADGGFFDIE